MNKSTLKSTLVAAAVSLAFLAPAAHAQANRPSRDTGVSHSIAEQGNAALRLIRAELKAAAVRATKPVLPVRPRKVSAPVPASSAPAAGSGASIAATAACAE